MSARLARTADGWWLVTPAGLIRLGLPAVTTARLLADRAALEAAIQAAQAAAITAPQDAVPAESLHLLSPVTAPARVIAQMVNYRSHALDSGFDPNAVPLAFFRKASHSITGPAGDIIRPDGAGFLDYEVELGLVIGADLPVGTSVTEAGLARYVAALVVADDVSARQIQLTKTQFYEAKSYPTFTPLGPWLTLVDAADLSRLSSMRLTLFGERAGAPGQHRGGHDRRAGAGTDLAVPVPADVPRRPAADRHAGRYRTEGAGARSPGSSPGYCRPPPGGSCSSSGRARNPRYLRDGDVITATIASPGGQLRPRHTAHQVIGRHYEHARDKNTAAAVLHLTAAVDAATAGRTASPPNGSPTLATIPAA